MARFPDDYPIAILQGSYRPGHSKRLRVLANRMEWLADKLRSFPGRIGEAPAAAYVLNELATLAIVVEMIEGRFPHGAPQRFTLDELDVLAEAVRARMDPCPSARHDDRHQAVLAKIVQLQTHVSNNIAADQAEKE